MDALTIKGLTVAYGATLAVEDATITVPKGAVMGLIGPNGAGKSTVIKAALGLIPSTSRECLFFGQELDSVRDRVAYMPQAAAVDWDYPITVEQVVAMGLYSELGWFKRMNPAHRARVADAMERVGITELAKRQISELSGGQRRRVFVARVLVQKPDFYLLDEPFAGVDAASEKVIRGVLHELRDAGATIAIVHHDLSTVTELCDHVCILNKQVVACGPVDTAFTRDNINTAFGLGLL
ncbi:ATPase component of Mn/Zn ABC-type transporter [Corynebacterium mustelae]|uniref:ATPase component of Mn/Zn ABC-type transporter n=1 Tax=Corynebacterium mustelae TaxID=571915 RepID=A0A0G3GVC4_9CORY|nr:metal ABC transporter ATP-binding protein [Corynebacterium mustelae]AKK04480.1 ATPase component of Mn/Zn ABC-type transporter [Corynebacterium mustelae]